ncbi:MAG: hypothetical protein M3Z10_01985 [Gemmatimonadota bacterium]|nr:hypothetical protein [Gemmatimonadota bacterium]
MSRSLVAITRLVISGGVVAVCLGCGSGSDLDKELATVRSWTATVHLAAEERHVGATTAAYTRQLRDRAAEALDQERQQLTKAEQSPDARARAMPALDSLTQAIHALGEASRP